MPRHAQVTEAHLLLFQDDMQPALRLTLWALFYSKPADSLKDWNACKFDEWLTESGHTGIERGKSRVVDFTEAQAMGWLGTNSKRATAEAVKEAVKASYLLRIASGVKGHPSLYVIAPNIAGQYSPKTPNEAGENTNRNAPPNNTDAPPNTPQYAPNFPNETGDTNKLLTNNLENAQQGGAGINAAPVVRKGDLCPYCKNSHVAPIEKVLEDPKPELRGELRCPNCYAKWTKSGKFKKFSKDRGYEHLKYFNEDGTKKG